MQTETSFWGKILAWIAKRLAQLVIIVAILLAILWVKREWTKIQSSHETAAECEHVASRMEHEIVPLAQSKEELESQVRTLASKLSSQEERCSKTKIALDKASENLESIRDAEHWWYTSFLNGDYYGKLAIAEEAFNAATVAHSLAEKNFDEIKAELKKSSVGKELTKIVTEIESKRSSIETLRNRATKSRLFASQHPLSKAWSAILGVLPTALGILAGVILVPVGIKASFYWILAPLCSKAPPLVVIPNQGVGIEIGHSEISAPVTLDIGDKLLVHSRYLQASGAGPGKRTKFLYSWKLPFTSLAAGLYALVQVHNVGDKPTEVTVSPKEDLFDRLTKVVIPAGESLVIYPRSIAAIVQRGGSPPRISRHWKIFNIHSFTTFQFRYLIIHGPCELILRGCRGIRAERLTADNNDRMQDLGSTLGFSPGIGYSTIRCDAFTDYLIGRDQLFNDRFRGNAGVFLSDEVPDPRHAARGIFGRGLEGVFDTILKGFGIC